MQTIAGSAIRRLASAPLRLLGLELRRLPSEQTDQFERVYSKYRDRTMLGREEEPNCQSAHQPGQHGALRGQPCRKGILSRAAYDGSGPPRFCSTPRGGWDERPFEQTTSFAACWRSENAGNSEILTKMTPKKPPKNLIGSRSPTRSPKKKSTHFSWTSDARTQCQRRKRRRVAS
jgi:hypothetical protein